ncbi:carboxypeptidase-like regulatory domain-containing protein [Flavihumibacter sp. R14]|nr:carboxypeptidase-like regulatory domain-containing protein [Flavihumibacter soli]
MKLLLACFLLALNVCAYGQQLSGTIVDKQTGEPVTGAIIRSPAATTTSGLKGKFNITVAHGDTLIVYKEYYKSFRLSVQVISGPLKIELDKSSIVLKDVIISARRSDPTDSLANRAEFEKEFNFKPPGVKDIFMVDAPRSKSTLLSLNLGGLYSVLTRKKSKEYRFQQKLLIEEQERFVDRKFNVMVVSNATDLRGGELNEFLSRYRPSYDFVKAKSAYDMQLYIRESYRKYKGGIR